MRKLL
jgi:Ni,Fe-hydrogenase III small subunit